MLWIKDGEQRRPGKQREKDERSDGVRMEACVGRADEKSFGP